MKSPTFTTLLAAVCAASVLADEEIVVTVDANQTWLGFMNVSELPENGGAFVFSSPWGTADLVAVFSGSDLILSPNTVSPPAGLTDVFWFKPDGTGNKTMEANMYAEESGPYAGKTIVFNGSVSATTLADSHTVIAFIKDFAPDYSSFVGTSVALEPGEFSISLETIDDPARHVQFGFTMTGPNVWITDVEPFGTLTIEANAVEPVDPDFTVDASAEWLGYMNVFRLPEPDDDGAQLIGILDVLPPEALTAVFGDGILTLTPFPYTPDDGLDDPDWYFDFGDGQGVRGNRWMEANMYVELPAIGLTGQTTTFTGEILSHTLTAGHQSYAFIKEFDAADNMIAESRVLLEPGPFNVQLVIGSDPTGHVQYGFQTLGPNVWPADLASFGTVVVEAGTAPPNAFAAWINSFDFSGFTAPDLSLSGDPDGDGRSNAAEFALDDDPTSGVASGKFISAIETIDGGQALVLTLPVRGNPEFTGSASLTASIDGVTYLIEGTNNLTTFDQPVAEVSPAITAGLPALNAGWNYRSFRLDGDINGENPRGPQGFLRANITPTP